MQRGDVKEANIVWIVANAYPGEMTNFFEVILN